LLLRALRAGDIDRLLRGVPAAGTGAQQQQRRSTALSSKLRSAANAVSC